MILESVGYVKFKDWFQRNLGVKLDVPSDYKGEYIEVIWGISTLPCKCYIQKEGTFLNL